MTHQRHTPKDLRASGRSPGIARLSDSERYQLAIRKATTVRTHLRAEAFRKLFEIAP